MCSLLLNTCTRSERATGAYKARRACTTTLVHGPPSTLPPPPAAGRAQDDAQDPLDVPNSPPTHCARRQIDLEAEGTSGRGWGTTEWRWTPHTDVVGRRGVHTAVRDDARDLHDGTSRFYPFLTHGLLP